jgi:drug/metabolite transporter (DMT)-like permease
VSAAHRTAAPGRGIALMCGGVFCMLGLDVCAKWLLGTYSLSQLVLLRCGFSALVIAWYAWTRAGPAALQTRRPAWHLARSVIMTGSMFAFFYALPRMPLADVLTLAFAAPLIVTALSWPVLGEAVGPWRWGAVLAGFGGVLIVLRPGAGLVAPAALIALGGAFFYALLSLSARRLSTTESTVALSLYLFPTPMLVSVPGALGNWIDPSPLDWALFAACGGFGGLAFVLITGAFRHAPAAVLVPFEYTGLVWAAAAGYLIWDEVPAPATWLGGGTIVASGLFILYRETRRHRAQPQADFPLQESVVPRAEALAGVPREDDGMG